MVKVGRLRQRKEFTQLKRVGKSRATSAFVLLYSMANDGEINIGFTASKKIGNAVKRVRAKRRLRAIIDEVVRLNPEFKLPSGKGYSINLIARYKVIDIDYKYLIKDLKRELEALGCVIE